MIHYLFCAFILFQMNLLGFVIVLCVTGKGGYGELSLAGRVVFSPIGLAGWLIREAF